MDMPAEIIIRRHRVLDIVAATAAVTGVPTAVITGHRRDRVAVLARRIVCVVARAEGRSLPEIGRRLGGRDHTTVLHNIRAHEEAPEVLDKRIAAVRERLAGIEPCEVETRLVAAPQRPDPPPAPAEAVATPPRAPRVPSLAEDRAPQFSPEWWANNDQRFRMAWRKWGGASGTQSQVAGPVAGWATEGPAQ